MDAWTLMLCTLLAGNVFGGILYDKDALNQGHEYSLGTIVHPIRLIKVTNTVAVPVPYAVSISKEIPVPVQLPKLFTVTHPVPHTVSVVVPKPVPVPHVVLVPQSVPVPVDSSLDSVPVPIDHLVAPTYNPNQQDDYRGYESYAPVVTAEEDYADYSSSQGSYSEQHRSNKEEYNYKNDYSKGPAKEDHDDTSFETTNSVEKREEGDSQNFKSSY